MELIICCNILGFRSCDEAAESPFFKQTQKYEFTRRDLLRVFMSAMIVQ